MARSKAWFSMSKKSDELAEIEIFDEIDSMWGIGPKEFKAAFDQVKDAKAVKLLLTSPGGSVFDGMAIYTILSSIREKLSVEVISLAASIASIIALSGSSLVMARGSHFMIHNPWTVLAGGADDLRKTADILDKMKADYVSIYSEWSGLEPEKVSEMMDAETWLTADEAVENGFASAVADYGQIAARTQAFALGKFNYSHIPQPLAEAAAPSKIDNVRDLERLLRDAGGFSKSEAVTISSQGWNAFARRDSETETSQGEPAAEPAPIQDLALMVREKELEHNLRRLA